MIKGTDISSWQGSVDFIKLKSATDFTIMKVSEGVGFIDPKFKTYQTNARSAGILIGYYHFCRPDLGNTPEAEAEFFVKTCQAKEGEVLALDFEVTFADKVNWCKKWLDKVYLLTKCRPLIYLNKSTIASNNWSSVISGNYGLWMADYSYNPDSEVPDNPWPLVAMRQYSNKEVFPGVSTPVDANVFYGDKTTFKKYGLPLQAEPPIPSNPCEQVIKELNACKEAQKVLLDQLDVEVASQKTLQVKLEEANALIKRLQEMGNNPPLSDYTAKELLSALWEKVKS